MSSVLRQVSEPSPAAALSPGEAPATTSEFGIARDELMTVHDVARILRVPVSWVYEHARRSRGHRLPAIKVGKYLRFAASDVRAYVAELRLRRR